MTLLNVIRNHPVALATVLLGAFGAWVAIDSSGRSKPPTEDLDAPPVNAPMVAELKPPANDGIQFSRDPSRPGVVTADLIPQLQVGMARAAVEELIGLPPAGLPFALRGPWMQLDMRWDPLASFRRS